MQILPEMNISKIVQFIGAKFRDCFILSLKTSDGFTQSSSLLADAQLRAGLNRSTGVVKAFFLDELQLTTFSTAVNLWLNMALLRGKYEIILPLPLQSVLT